MTADKQNATLAAWMSKFSSLQAIKVVDHIRAYSLEPYYLNTNPNSIPVTSITTRDDIFKAVDEITTLVPSIVSDMAYSREEAYRLITIMAELCQNIIYHSRHNRRIQGYIALQPDPHHLKFIAMDLGPGIPATLKHKYRYHNDAEAICLACRAGITSKNSGGLGLYQTVQILEQTAGSMRIISGSASVVFCSDGVYRFQRSDPLTFSGYNWGTQIGILLPQKQVKEGV